MRNGGSYLARLSLELEIGVKAIEQFTLCHIRRAELRGELDCK